MAYRDNQDKIALAELGQEEGDRILLWLLRACITNLIRNSCNSGSASAIIGWIKASSLFVFSIVLSMKSLKRQQDWVSPATDTICSPIFDVILTLFYTQHDMAQEK